MAQPAHNFAEYWFPSEWTEDMLSELPEDGHRYEILDGSLLMTPPASWEHQGIGMALTMLLKGAAPPGWRVRYEIGVRVPQGNFIPDLAVFYPDRGRPGDWQDAQDVALVIEIASKSTETNDVGNKVIKYAQAGIPSYWRIARDGTLFVHTEPRDNHYEVTTIAKPGVAWSTTVPFPIAFDPAVLLDDV